MSAWRRPDGSFYFPPTRDPLDLVMQSQLRRIARSLGESMARVTDARKQSRIGEHEEWVMRGQVSGLTGKVRGGQH